MRCYLKSRYSVLYYFLYATYQTALLQHDLNAVGMQRAIREDATDTPSRQHTCALILFQDDIDKRTCFDVRSYFSVQRTVSLSGFTLNVHDFSVRTFLYKQHDRPMNILLSHLGNGNI